MLFNSFTFLCLFLPVTYVVFWCLKGSSSRYLWLTLTGYVFYGYWDPRFTILMAFSTLVSYLAGLGFLRWQDPRQRRWCLIVPISLDLLLLGFFKYANFLMGAVGSVARAAGWSVEVPVLQVVLPIGISFYTFHTISYIVDCYRGVVKPTRNIFEFAAYVSLFSQLVAGPIVRFRQIESDLEAIGTTSRTRWLARGVSFFLAGLFQKVVIADTLARWVDPAFASYAQLGTADLWVMAVGYSLQLYFDFSGYSDMAVGLGYMFGLRIPQNFNSPYKSLDPSDFWRRWHISLSSCLRDYVYIPLGGNRSGDFKAYRNLILTMLIGGLWHGANWTFVVWGAYHGVLLALYRRFSAQWNLVPTLGRQAAMFVLTVLGWVVFRSVSLDVASDILRMMFQARAGERYFSGAAVAFIGAMLVIAMAGPNAYDLHPEQWTLRPARAFTLAAVFGVCVALMAGTGSSPFLYFQF